MNPGDAERDIVALGPLERKLTSGIDAVLAIASTVVILAWVLGRPILHSPASPVLSPFTAFSILVLVLVRLARLYDKDWPVALNSAMTGLVLGGNVSSIILIALVPGGLSLLGYLLSNPTYLSVHADPRVGISPLDMVFMALYAVAAVISNPRLFLWGFLAANRTDRLVFAGLFANQFAVPLVVALAFRNPGSRGPGLELFEMLAGAVTTMVFLLLQARAHLAG